MIQSLTLKNFRSWKEGYVEFSKGITILQGENDNGKTNILRAINLVANNRPLGEDFRSNWGGDTTILMQVDNKLIGRCKTDTDNFYTLTHENGKEEEFRAFNKGVPDKIKQLINFSDVNIGFQLDGPFLLGKSPSDVAKYYNEAVNLDIIDRSISNIKSTLKSEKTEKAQIESNIKKHEEDLEKLKWLDDVEPKIVHLENLQKNVQKKVMDFSVLSELIQSFNQQEEQLIKLKKITIHEDFLKKLEILYNTYEKALSEFELLDEFIEKIKGFDDQTEKINRVLVFENKIDNLIKLDQDITIKTDEYNELGKFITNLKTYNNEEIYATQKIKNEPLLNSLFELNQKIEVKNSEYNDLANFVEQLKNYDKNIENLYLDLDGLEYEYKTLLPDICPIFEEECQKLKQIKQKS